jgi:hypothetical protein
MAESQQHARDLLAKIHAGLIEQERLRKEYEEARRDRIAAEQQVARLGRRVLFSFEFTIHF